MAAGISFSQQPFDLDPGFQTSINTWYVASVAPLDDGKILVSGQVKFPGDVFFRSSTRLNPDGSKDVTYADVTYAGGKLTAWNGRYYAGNGPGVRRMWPDGSLDTSFILINDGPYFSALQGGDYHVFPDGRLLMSGAHHLSDSIRGFVGLYNLIWFSDQGYLDTTRIHRDANGVLYEIERLYDGGFICSGNASLLDGQPTGGWIFRVDSTGAVDTTFQTGVYWGEADVFLPLPDGRCYAGGNFRIIGIPDTLKLVRFMPDGSLDPTFNHLLDLQAVDITATYGAVVVGIYPLDENRLIVTGGFEIIEGQARQGICMIDTAGNLIDDYFTGPGCADYTYMGFTYGEIDHIVPAPDGSWYIHGAYHGYADGTTNDPGQRMVSRLHGLDVGIGEQFAGGSSQLIVSPNPADGLVQVEVGQVTRVAMLALRDALGRMLFTRAVSGQQMDLDLRGLAPGVYLLALEDEGRRLATARVVVE